MASFSFVLTEVCNWKCEYCYFTNLKNQKSPNLKTFKKHIPYIKKIIEDMDDLVVNIDIQGGEVGTIPINILEYFFEMIGPLHKIVVSTNGVFLDRKIHKNKNIKKYISSIMWHLSDLNVNKGKIKDYNIEDLYLSRGIVHSDVNQIIDFIKNNKHIIFDYVEFEFDINKPKEKNIIMYHDLLKKIEKLNNVTENAKNIIRNRITENPRLRSICQNYNHSILIDMVNENICLCQRQLDSNISLNKENLIKRLCNFPKDIFKGDCSSCTRLYAGKYSGNVIERSLLTRRKLGKNI